MGINYTFYLRVGYSIAKKAIAAPYSTYQHPIFHYEDRFDYKTGEKLKPVKIIERKGGSTFKLEYEGNQFDSLSEVIHETNFFQNKFECGVSQPFDFSESPNFVNFYLELPNYNEICHGKVTLFEAAITLTWLDENKN